MQHEILQYVSIPVLHCQPRFQSNELLKQKPERLHTNQHEDIASIQKIPNPPMLKNNLETFETKEAMLRSKND